MEMEKIEQNFRNMRFSCFPAGDENQADTVQFVRHEHNVRSFGKFSIVCVALALLTISVGASEVRPKLPSPSRSYVGSSFVVTQLPRGMGLEQEAIAGGMLRADYGDGARVVMLLADRTTKVLSRGFYSACDPEISLDASHILFAGKRKPVDNWDIYEMAVDGSNPRQITKSIGNCRSPGYQATLYTIISDKPWYQLTFVGSERGALNEYGITTATNLYSCKLDGSAVRRLTFNLSSDMDPFIMPDGRLL
jgi:hypothetical protein